MLQALDMVGDGVYITDRERRILYWNAGAARVSGYHAQQVVGTRCSDNVLIHVDDAGTSLCSAGCPLAATMSDGEPRRAHAYLHHRDGHRVPVTVRTAALQEESGTIVGAVEVFSESQSLVSLREKMHELEKASLTDPLTGLPNRRHIEAAIDRSLASLERYGHPFGLLFADIDHFKHVNDAYGHDAGDNVLKMVAATITGSMRASDAAGRWGGEEFVLIVAEVSPETLPSVAERVRNLVEQSWLLQSEMRIAVTVSIGASTARPGDTRAGLVARADSLMYRSKQLGRNRVTMDPAEAERR